MLLEIENLKVAFRTRRGSLPVVRGLDLAVAPGEAVAIVGESGSGKSVTSLAIMGLLDGAAQVEGEFRFQSEAFEPHKGRLRGRKMAMVFQNPMSTLNPVMKVGLQIAEPVVHLLGKSAAQARTRAQELMTEVGLPRAEALFDSYPHELSGGMRQRIVIAMALACEPDLLIADEPTTALDVTIQAQILDLMAELQKSRGLSIIMVTHDMSVVQRLAQKVCVMYAGQIVERGPLEEVLNQAKHPYTQLLLRSIPKLEEGSKPEALAVIEGRPPRPDELDGGCAFAPRCPLVEASCRNDSPGLKSLNEQHAARCFLLEASDDKTA